MNIKDFYKKHKAVIVGGVVVAVSCGVAIILTKKIALKHTVNIKGKDAITWKPGNRFSDLEEVKRTLDANVESSAVYAILREGINPNEYTIIQLNGTKIL